MVKTRGDHLFIIGIKGFDVFLSFLREPDIKLIV